MTILNTKYTIDFNKVIEKSPNYNSMAREVRGLLKHLLLLIETTGVEILDAWFANINCFFFFSLQGVKGDIITELVPRPVEKGGG